MKGKGKRLAALLTLLVLCFSSVLVVSADSNTTLIKRSTSVSNQAFDHTEVSVAPDTTDTTGFTLTVKRANDSFTLYNLVTLNPSANTENGITSLDLQWEAPVAEFIANSATFSGDPEYATPNALGAYTVDQNLSEAARVAAEKAAKAEREKKLIKLVNAMKSQYANAVEKSSTAIGRLTPAGGINGTAVADGTTPNYELLGSSQNLSLYEPANIIGTGVSGDSWNMAYDITGLSFGLYFVDASNPARATGQGYQPVVVDLVPEQTGPSGHWYIDNTKTATLKNESINIVKKINGGDNDIIREGEMVNFTVDFDVPLYTKTDNKYTFTKFNAFDDMSQGFTLIATSAKLTFFDANGNEFHVPAALTGDAYGNKIANDIAGTYTAQLIGFSYPVTYSEGQDPKEYFYISPVSDNQITVWTNNGGELNSYLMMKSKTNGKYVFNTSDLNTINNKLGTDDKIPAAYITSTNASKFVVADTSKSLIGVVIDYEKLMNPDTYTPIRESATPVQKAVYTMSDDFTVPAKISVTYDALVNDDAYLGNDNNTNKVTVYYVEDTTGTIGTAEDEVVAWTYGANIVKVDGTAYDEFEALSSEEKAQAIAEGKTPYLEGAVFDIFRYDVEYCGGSANANQSAVPVESIYNTFNFYDDAEYPVLDPTDSNLTSRYAGSRGLYSGILAKALTYELTQKMSLTDPLTIGQARNEALAAVGSYATADQFTNKYDFTDIYASGTFKDLHDNFGGNALLDYMNPMAKTDQENGISWDTHEDFSDGYVTYVPRWVEAGECRAHSGAHWHLDAYSLFWADAQSVATEEGITLTGFDPNKYLMVEKVAPAGGYNKMNAAIYFEINQLSNEQFTERGNSYAGFMSDEYEDADGNLTVDDNEDGIYHFTVKNYSGLTLPSTGGIGTLLFTLIGIVVMGGAIIFVIARNRKLKNSAATFMALVMALTLALSFSFTSNAATTISLGNSDGINVGAQKAVPNGKAVFTVHLRDEGDVLNVYQIATCSYDDEEKTFSDIEWVPNLYAYLGNYSLDTGNDNIPTDPGQFTQLDAKQQTDFLTWIYDSKDKSGVGSINKIASNQIVTSQNPTTKEYYATIRDVEYGMYLVKGENPELNRSYSVLTLSAAPEIQGPMGVYYLTGDLEATLKYADVTISKYINMGKSDVVRTGEVVNFEVVGEVPEYYPIEDGVVYTKDDGEAYSLYDWDANYTFSITDDMSTAFRLDPTTLKIYTGNDPSSQDAWTEVPADYYTALIAPEYKAVEKTGTIWYRDSKDTAGNYFVKYAKPNGSTWAITWYVYNDKEGKLIKFAEGSASSESAVMAVPDSSIISSYQEITGVASVGTVARVENRPIFAITFNYSKFVDIDSESGKWVRNNQYVALVYDATVTENCLPGTENNTNTAKLWYRSDIAGHYTPVEDTVRAYTYALRLIKTDGEVANKYLLGAEFKLYKEAYIYVPNTTAEGVSESTFTAEPTSNTWQYYKFDSYANNGEYASELTTAPVDDAGTTLSTLDLAESAEFEGGLNTYFRYVPVKANEDGIPYDHFKVVVYKQMALPDQIDKDSTGADYQTVKENKIISVDTEDGVLLDGLEEASYVLIETKQPTGYNALTEAMRFEIRRLSAEQHALTENAAYTTDAIFYSANQVDINDPELTIVDAVALEETDGEGNPVINYYQGYSDGIYGINVKNYQGLTLPSTGGMGTLLFTIIGIILMAAVILLIVLKQRKSNESYM
ncbi:LPXTG-motif cell wall anchor domain-containing protein/fimbrial isopeptide formation D2 domain-containing protein [Pseudobutyrivibrio sp. OR37]|uniref:LPXTG cell wall anchor domain-containing protein n=1 Tax=Pseudobutyrivibrio sp. OR37 TaxID=1798186 RepID=UPI0008EF5213|nr:LPXTG cell wall anchor domain-containing protein [Pseudobutyrivibrio sp. OR37]SFH52843.1 LPXTG-motif cell wall anchor domain-containing protein/fimbrial isopeptide formation D2 domain-containing protein [Pseudobutyrivibrio sp. OR37]